MYDKEIAFFHEIASKLIDFERKTFEKNDIARLKGTEGDYTTHLDLNAEAMIADAIKEQFPGDKLLAEENYSDTSITTDRTWIVDPICGTSNLGRGIGLFCTNIALAMGERIVAACVVDHAQHTYYWAVEGSSIFRETKEYEAPKKRPDFKIDMDLYYLTSSDEIRERLLKAVGYIAENTNYIVSSLDSSLSFLYVALGKFDGVINVSTNPWDNAASAFLIRNSGKIITDLDGKEWHVRSGCLVAAGTKEVHAQLLASVKV